jgi:hypothetical protein
MNNYVTFERGSNGQFSPQTPTPAPGASSGEAAGYAALGALITAGFVALWSHFTKEDEK